MRIRSVLLTPIELGVVLLTGVVLLPIWLLPWSAAVQIGRGYGLVVACAQPRLRRVAMINLRRAYGAAMTRARARRQAWRVFANSGQSLAEGIQLSRRIRAGGTTRGVPYEVEDRGLEKRILADPRPKIFVTGHVGSWELSTMLAGLRHGRSGSVIARRVDNRFAEPLVRWLRFTAGFGVIEKRGATTRAIRCLRRGESVAMLADENAGRRGVFVEFFGRPAATTRLPALLALMTGAPIVLGAVVRAPAATGPPLRFRLALFEPDCDADVAVGVHALTQAVVRQYEAWVRDNPCQWRWIHWRWKTRPDGSEETYTRRDLAAVFAMPRGGVSDKPRRRVARVPLK